MAINYDWAVKLAIEKLCERLTPDTIAQIDGVVKAGIGIKQQFDRVEVTQIAIYKQNELILAFMRGISEGFAEKIKENANSIGHGASPKSLEPPAATGK